MNHLKVKPVTGRIEAVLQPHMMPIVSAYYARNFLQFGKLFGLLVAKALFVFTAVFVAWFVFTHLPVPSMDWVNHFRPAALQWQAPYFRPGTIFNPPWLFPLLYPLAVLPHRVGIGALTMLSILAVGLYTKSVIKLLFVMASVAMGAVIVQGQLDALLLYGLMIPYGLGIPLLLTKPQGVFLAILPRLNRWSILFTVLIFGVSILIWGNWWVEILAHRPNPKANLSLFPYSIPLGIFLAYLGLRRKSDALLCTASLCFVPYFMAQSMLPAIAAAVRETDDWRWWSLIVVGSWVYVAAMKGFLW